MSGIATGFPTGQPASTLGALLALLTAPLAAIASGAYNSGTTYYFYGQAIPVVAPASGRIVLEALGQAPQAIGPSLTGQNTLGGAFLSSAAGTPSTAWTGASSDPTHQTGYIASDQGANMASTGVGVTGVSPVPGPVPNVVSYSNLTPGQTYYVRPWTQIQPSTSTTGGATIYFPVVQVLQG